MRPTSGNAALALMLSLVLTACGGRAINKKTALDVITAQGPFKQKDLDIKSVSQTTPGQAVVEVKLPAAFRLEKQQEKWIVREVRIGNEWQKMDDVAAALNTVKVEETKKMLGRIAEAIDAYRRKNGGLPDFREYVSLSDALSPDYLQPLIREDPWGNPLVAIRMSPVNIRLLSAGPDGKVGTPDDIELSRSYR